ncbi:MAG: anti-sigma factor antagonist [Lachnospiraceae bacterium]|nr:anti-sigma factor antagonist [Lachnospiraceae bacterium]
MEEFQVIENCLMIKLPEEVDHHRAGYISERADCFIAQSAVEHVVFDFEDTQFMDSSGIGIIAGRYKQIACLGGKVYAIHANPQILRMLTLSGLNKLVICDYK